MTQRLDIRTMALILAGAALGAISAALALASTGGARNDLTVRPLVWAIFGTPLLTFAGWAIARRAEAGLAAVTCLCVYLFTPFVAARAETLLAQQPDSSHTLYFIAAIVLEALAGVVIAIWRARSAEGERGSGGAGEWGSGGVGEGSL